jgi:hypothetical protein
MYLSHDYKVQINFFFFPETNILDICEDDLSKLIEITCLVCIG